MTLARGTDRIESQRLILRRITPADAEFFIRIHADPVVARYLGHGRPRTPDETRSWLDLVYHSYDELELGPLAVIRKSDGVLVGRCGLNDLAIEAKPAAGAVPKAWFGRSTAPADTEVVFEAELGYTFDAAHWGQGFASEAAGRVFEYARDTRKLGRVISLIHPDNARSQRVAGKYEVRKIEAVELQGTVFERYLWPT